MANYNSARTGVAHDNDDTRIATLEAQNLNNRIATLESTIQSLQDTINTQNGTILTLNNRIATFEQRPHVIAAGGNGITASGGYWHKWNTGLAEWWTIESTTSSHYYTQPGSGFGAYKIRINFPQGLFTSPPHIVYAANCENGFALTGTITDVHSQNYVELYLLSSNNSQRVTYWYIYAFGVCNTV